MDDDVNDETKMIDDLCYFEFLRKRLNLRGRIYTRVQRGHTREEGEAFTTYKCGVY